MNPCKTGARNNFCEADEWMIKSSKKMNLSVKESRGLKRSFNSKCSVMIKDLKDFADCLIAELNIARENMFADMREEIKNLGLRPSKKTLRCSNKNGIEVSMKLQNCSSSSMDRNAALDAYKLPKTVADYVAYDHLPELETAREADKIACGIFLGHSYNQAVSTPHLPVLPDHWSQNHQIRVPLKNRIPAGVSMNNSGLETEVATTLMNAENFRHQNTHYAGMSGLLGQNNSLAPVVDFPVRQSCSNNSFLYNTRIGLKFNGMANQTLSDRLFPDNTAPRTDGESVPVRTLDLRNGQCFQRNQW